MKKNYLAVVAAIGILGFVAFRIVPFHPTRAPSVREAATKKAPVVTVVIDDGAHIATYSGVTASTPFAALSSVSSANHIPLTTKRYDFGLFVSAIGGLESGADKAWIYFVNGASGTVSSDAKTIQTGDIVQWRYVKPQEN